jgi:hypothetical protein
MVKEADGANTIGCQMWRLYPVSFPGSSERSSLGIGFNYLPPYFLTVFFFLSVLFYILSGGLPSFVRPPYPAFDSAVHLILVVNDELRATCSAAHFAVLYTSSW